jgi:Prokaryotic membrane lipoprotein lipid attachment site
MKKTLLPLSILILLSSCSIFRKQEKLGCPNDATGKSQEQILKDSNKTKYKGGKKF